MGMVMVRLVRIGAIFQGNALISLSRYISENNDGHGKRTDGVHPMRKETREWYKEKSAGYDFLSLFWQHVCSLQTFDKRFHIKF